MSTTTKSTTTCNGPGCTAKHHAGRSRLMTGWAYLDRSGQFGHDISGLHFHRNKPPRRDFCSPLCLAKWVAEYSETTTEVEAVEAAVQDVVDENLGEVPPDA